VQKIINHGQKSFITLAPDGDFLEGNNFSKYHGGKDMFFNSRARKFSHKNAITQQPMRLENIKMKDFT